MQDKKEVESSSLAFIDVMTCGLGAVILLLILLEFGDTEVSDDELKNSVKTLSEELESKRSLYLDLNEMIKKKKIQIGSLTTTNSINSAVEESLKQNISDEQNIQKDLFAKLKNKNKNKNKNLEPEKPKDSLLGINVEGSRILILLDISKSMSHKNLVDIYTSSPTNYGEFNKFLQSQKIYNWLISSLPSSCKFNSMIFNDEAKIFDKEMVDCSSEEMKVSASLFISGIQPSKGTSLGLALEKITEMDFSPTDIYIITDGLPTLPGSNVGIRVRKGCFSLKIKSITGDCRIALFQQAVSVFTKSNPNVKINVIMLPLEGDPKAAPLYWNWATQSGGRYMNPDKKWLS